MNLDIASIVAIVLLVSAGIGSSIRFGQTKGQVDKRLERIEGILDNGLTDKLERNTEASIRLEEKIKALDGIVIEIIKTLRKERQ